MYNTAARQALTRFIFFITIFIQENIIETYHGLTTSKPMQLRCFQSG